MPRESRLEALRRPGARNPGCRGRALMGASEPWSGRSEGGDRVCEDLSMLRHLVACRPIDVLNLLREQSYLGWLELISTNASRDAEESLRDGLQVAIAKT